MRELRNYFRHDQQFHIGVLVKFSYLVRNKLYPLDRVAGSTKYGKKRCEVTCDDNCLIYLLSCRCCGKQYAGEPTDNCRYRRNNCKDNDRKHPRQESCMQKHLFKHFNSMEQDGFLNNVSITLIDKTDGKNIEKREDYWRRTLKIYSPFGLNECCRQCLTNPIEINM